MKIKRAFGHKKSGTFSGGFFTRGEIQFRPRGTSPASAALRDSTVHDIEDSRSTFVTFCLVILVCRLVYALCLPPSNNKADSKQELQTTR